MVTTATAIGIGGLVAAVYIVHYLKQISHRSLLIYKELSAVNANIGNASWISSSGERPALVVINDELQGISFNLEQLARRIERGPYQPTEP